MTDTTQGTTTRTAARARRSRRARRAGLPVTAMAVALLLGSACTGGGSGTADDVDPAPETSIAPTTAPAPPESTTTTLDPAVVAFLDDLARPPEPEVEAPAPVRTTPPTTAPKASAPPTTKKPVCDGTGDLPTEWSPGVTCFQPPAPQPAAPLPTTSLPYG